MSVFREELAWAAGFFDGEGCVGLVKAVGRSVPFAQVAITQVDRRVLDRFASAVGVGRIYGPTKEYGRSRAQYRYIIAHHPAAQAICAMLWPWLSPVKREQFHRTLTAAVAALQPLCEHRLRRWSCLTCRRRVNAAKTKRYRIRKTVSALLEAV